MRPIATVVILGLALAALPSIGSLDALSGGALTLGLGVLAAVVTSGRGALSVALGALGALAYTYLARSAPELAAAVFVASAHGARSLRGRNTALRGAQTLASLAAGLGAGLVLSRYASADTGVLAAAALVAGLLAAAPLAIPSDDPVTFALAGLASESDEPTRSLLLRAVSVRRRVDAATIEVLPQKVTEQLEAAWVALVETARARATARTSAALLLDKRIARFIEVLERIYTAAEERAARAAGLDEKALLAAKMEGDRLEAEVSALIDVSTSVRVESDFTDAPVKSEAAPAKSEAAEKPQSDAPAKSEASEPSATAEPAPAALAN
ncbi:MAG: hypothetical protein JNK05_15855 [Myxococcales bacterium]|nr:hypothetical protein [Myxococcales bacterium]